MSQSLQAGLCKIFRHWVNFSTEHTVFCRKFNLWSILGSLYWYKFLNMQDNSLCKVFFVKILVYLRFFCNDLSSCYGILSFTLLCCKFGMVKTYAVFGVKFFLPKILFV